MSITLERIRRLVQKGALPGFRNMGMTSCWQMLSFALVVAGAVTAKKDSFTSSIRFYDTKNVAQQNLYATNFRLHGASTKLVLRNTGAEDIVATPRFRPVKGDPNDFIDLGGINLKPDETKSIDLDSLSRGTQGRSDFDMVSVDILNSGSKGSLIGALNGVDENSGLTYDVPLRDSGGPRNLSGAYPWRLDGDVSTIVSITNVTALDAQFVVQINYPGGPYLLDPQKTACRQYGHLRSPPNPRPTDTGSQRSHNSTLSQRRAISLVHSQWRPSHWPGRNAQRLGRNQQQL